MSKIKYFLTCILATTLILPTLSAQKMSKKEMTTLLLKMDKKIDSLQNVIKSQKDSTVPIKKEINPEWDKWQDVRYNYGFNTSEQPVHNVIDGILETTTMLSVRGGLGRWHNGTPGLVTSFVDGGHLFEGWNGTETCRLTMLIGKQAPDIACIQVYSPKGLYKPERHFGWVKIGSDSKKEGVDFGRRWAISFVPFSLANLDKTPVDTHNLNEQLGTTEIPLGTIYFDTNVGKVRCYTSEGWKYLSFE